MPYLFITSVILIAIAVAVFFIWKLNAYNKHSKRDKDGILFRRNVQAVNDLDLKLEELEVLDHLSEGHSNQEIADKTSMSLNTVNDRVRGIFSKLDVNRRSLAIKKARKLKLIP
ncbi:MAG: LuxR C-terminal-related transcriptional regulator [Gracilimonas sp.]|nr:LuxR C-terminal-related transcriptional regulator [Gracilimonas sp.]